MHCLRSYFVCQFPDSGYFSATWLLKQVEQISANKENFYWSNWVETFLKWKAKALYDKTKLGKKAKAWVEILTYLTPENLTVSSATSVSLNEAGSGWNCSRKRIRTYIVVKSGLRHGHKKWKLKWKVCSIIKLSLGISQGRGMTGMILFASQLPLNLVNGVHAANAETPNKSPVTLLAFSFCISISGISVLVWCWRSLSRFL